MLTLLKYAISLAIWAIVAGAFLIAGSPQIFAFWGLLGLIILIGWFYKMLWKWFIGIFFPTIQLRFYIIFMFLLTAAAVFAFEAVIVPGLNTWGATKDELKEEYPIDEFLPNANTITIRALTIEAQPKVVYPWVKQMATEGVLNFKVNLLDLIRNQPAKLVLQDLPEFNVGDRFLVGDIIQSKDNQGLTIELYRQNFPWNKFDRIYAGYYIHKGEDHTTRVVIKIKAEYSGGIAWFSAKYLIEIVDFLVSRYQLYTLKSLAEKPVEK